MSERDKLLERICARIEVDVLEEVDRFMREREREARVPLSRSLVVREILTTWAATRARARDPSAVTGQPGFVSTLSTK